MSGKAILGLWNCSWRLYRTSIAREDVRAHVEQADVVLAQCPETGLGTMTAVLESLWLLAVLVIMARASGSRFGATTARPPLCNGICARCSSREIQLLERILAIIHYSLLFTAPVPVSLVALPARGAEVGALRPDSSASDTSTALLPTPRRRMPTPTLTLTDCVVRRHRITRTHRPWPGSRPRP